MWRSASRPPRGGGRRRAVVLHGAGDRVRAIAGGNAGSAMEPPEPCVHRTDIQLRFGDTDALGHVNNASYARFAEVARLQLLDGVGASVRSIILAHLSIDFVRPVKFGDAVSVETRVGHLGRSSITLQQTVTAGGETAADIRSVLVFFDYQHNRARKLPTPLRKRLSQYQ